MALKNVEAAIAATKCECGPNERIPYTDVDGPRCGKCGKPLRPKLSRMTRHWLRQAIDEERARRAEELARG
jgi:hypothetical protein